MAKGSCRTFTRIATGEQWAQTTTATPEGGRLHDS